MAVGNFLTRMHYEWGAAQQTWSLSQHHINHQTKGEDGEQNRNMQTNIRRVFINLINSCFPLGQNWKKIFNRNTLKLSYTCTPNIKQVIDGHNKAILKKSYTHGQDQTTRMYNCCNQNDCPLKGECLQKEIIYQATVTTWEKLRCM